MRRDLCIWLLLTLAGAPRLSAQGVEARFGPVAYLSKRNASFDGNVGTATGTQTGIQLSSRWRFVGLEAQLLGATFSAASSTNEALGTVSSGHVDIVFGIPTISFRIGYGSRSFTGAIGSRGWGFGRVGAQSVIPIGASGLSTEAAVAWYARAPNASGREAETRLVFVPSRFPLYVGLGYRIEQFTSDGSAGIVAEESSGMSLSLGLRYTR